MTLRVARFMKLAGFSAFKRSPWYKRLIWAFAAFLIYLLVGFFALPPLIKWQMLKRLPAITELVKILCKHWGYVELKQEGATSSLQTEVPSRQRIPVPDHYHLRLGTLNSILRFVARHKGVEKEDVLRGSS